MRLLLLVLLLAVAGCGATESTTLSTIGEELQTAAAAPSPSAAQSASGIERLCAAFDIVTSEISPAYGAIADDTSDISVQMQGLVIMLAGSEIMELADGVLEPSFVEILERMGEGYIAEGEAVSEGQFGSSEAVSYYLDQVVEYGRDCP